MDQTELDSPVGEDFPELMRRVRDGSEEAAWELVTRHGAAIRRAVRRAMNDRLRYLFDSLDFVQLVWNSLFHAREKLERFQSPAELTAFLITMARNKVRDEARRRQVSEKRQVAPERRIDDRTGGKRTHLPDPSPAPIEVAIAHEQWARLLDGQPAHYRQIIHLRLQGHTYEAIAEALNIDPCTVRRFLKKLAERPLYDK